MRTRLLFYLFCGLCVAAGKSSAQEKEGIASEPAMLSVREIHSSEMSLQSGFSPDMQCDENGSIYLKTFEGGVPNKNTVYKISEREKKVIKFTPDSSEFNSAEGGSFAVAPDGEVYFAVWEIKPSSSNKRPQLYILSFHRDGSLNSRVKIEDQISPTKLAVFPTGEIFIAGMSFTTVGKPPFPFSVIYDSDGKKLKEIQFEADLPLKRAAEQAIQQPKEKPFGTNGELRSVSLSKIRTGPDGLVYLLRNTTPPVVYAISASGEIRNKIEVPIPTSGQSALGFQVDDRNIAVEFVGINKRNQSATIRILDKETGQLLRTYTSGPHGIGCYKAPDRFSFVTIKEGKLSVEIATP